MSWNSPSEETRGGLRWTHWGNKSVAMAFGVRLSLIAFSVECLTGLLEGGDFEVTISSAFLAGAVAWGLGWLLGELVRNVIEEHVKAEFAQAGPSSTKKTQTTTNK